MNQRLHHRWKLGILAACIIGVGAALVSGCLTSRAATPKLVARNNPTKLQWSGQSWNVQSGFGTPGPCNWNPGNAATDTEGNLHLKITRSGNKWYCSQISSANTVGYGTYTFKVKSDLRNFDPSVVLGMFTYDTTESNVGSSEVDIEIAKWSNPKDPNDVEYSIYPIDADPTHHGKRFPLGTPPYTAQFVWTKTHVAFSVKDATGNTHSFVGTNLPAPPAKPTKAFLNLWLFHGNAPVRGKPIEIVISSFHYTPSSG